MKGILIIIAGLLLISCKQKQVPADDKFYQQAIEHAKDIAGKQDTKISREEFLESWKEQGVDAFSFDAEGYLVYTVSEDDISADPDWVARQYYELASDVDSVKGCRLINLEGKEFGRYE